jgi:signal-transduction protein with cAMP-binding, CBS, and nucleotidyltransferase domain
LISVAKDMIKKHVGSVIVKDNEYIKGIITERDIVWAVVKRQDLKKVKAKDIMTKRVSSIAPGKDINEAMERIKKTKFKLLPVVVKNRVIGVVTIKDILRFQPSLIESVKEAIDIKEETEKLKRSKSALTGETWIKEGECGECGAYGLLYNVDGNLLCEGCKDTIM